MSFDIKPRIRIFNHYQDKIYLQNSIEGSHNKNPLSFRHFERREN